MNLPCIDRDAAAIHMVRKSYICTRDPPRSMRRRLGRCAVAAWGTVAAFIAVGAQHPLPVQRVAHRSRNAGLQARNTVQLVSSPRSTFCLKPAKVIR
jgi:hypothetical protein